MVLEKLCSSKQFTVKDRNTKYRVNMNQVISDKYRLKKQIILSHVDIHNDNP